MLAGGRSERFGRDKLVEPYRGAPLSHHAIRRLAEVCAEVVVVIAPSSPEPALPDGVRARIVRDPDEGEGPLAGARAGLLAARSARAILAGGDMPELQTRVLIELLRVLADGSTHAAALGEGDEVRPLPCALRAAPALEAADALLRAGRRSLRELLQALHVVIVPEESWIGLDPERRTLLDVDVPADLDR